MYARYCHLTPRHKQQQITPHLNVTMLHVDINYRHKNMAVCVICMCVCVLQRLNEEVVVIPGCRHLVAVAVIAFNMVTC